LIVIDSSALIAIINRKPERPQFLRLIAAAGTDFSETDIQYVDGVPNLSWHPGEAPQPSFTRA
jgi:uncharacterized protein with PIN domain